MTEAAPGGVLGVAQVIAARMPCGNQSDVTGADHPAGIGTARITGRERPRKPAQ